ncbi:hypothetical protein SAMN05216308_10626 [Nitrosospira sp. Nsp13]|nr:hypothetical protein SAMN05216308_10626 [Nitrosospira sp. Nsp13]
MRTTLHESHKLQLISICTISLPLNSPSLELNPNNPLEPTRVLAVGLRPNGLSGLKHFAVSQITPLSSRKITQFYLADANALQPGYFQPDQFAHSTDLTFLAFT